MTSARKKQLLAVGILAAAGAGLSLMSMGGIEQNLVYYWSPKDIHDRGEQAKSAVIRLGGVVCKQSLEWNPQTLQLHFKVGMDLDGNGPTVAVFSSSAPPQMFREGIGVVVEGRYDGALFTAERLMVKHSNEYHPPKEGEAPHDMMKSMQDDMPKGSSAKL